ncbi:hypothetical protein ABMB44_12525 [Levilactobacillus brevis]
MSTKGHERTPHTWAMIAELGCRPAARPVRRWALSEAITRAASLL